MKIEFAKSLSGHDKGKIYLIWKKEGRLAYLVDGTVRTMASPKKKNEKHYQIVKHIPEDITERLKEKQPLTDDSIRRAVRAYEQTLNHK